MGISINGKPLELKDGGYVFSCTRSGSITEDDADNKVCVCVCVCVCVHVCAYVCMQIRDMPSSDTRIRENKHQLVKRDL